MTAEVIDIATRRPQTPELHVWRCDCGTISFLLRSDGQVECCGCREIQNTGNARWAVCEPYEASVSQFPSKETSVDQQPS